MSAHRVVRAACAAAVVAAAGCAPHPAPRSGTSGAPVPATLKAAFQGVFYIGAAVNENQFSGIDQRGATLVREQFASITPENDLKWERVHPQPGVFDFAAPDRYVAFGERNGLFIVGHTLVWHNQTPRWVFQDPSGQPVSRDTLIARLREHIQTVVGRYRGRIRGWDVVNEALNEDGTLRHSPWFSIIGEDYIAMAFRFAHEADPAAELYYNDYSLENAPKRQGAVELVRRLRAEGVPITGIGSQDHVQMDWPTSAQVDSTLTALGQLGVRVMITELDVDVLPRATQQRGADVTLNVAARSDLNPYVAGLPDSVQQALARRYADLFAVYLRHRDVVERVTFWGVTDGDSWKNNWPVRGRTNYPLLFDREGRPKPAFDAVIRVARQAAGR